VRIDPTTGNVEKVYNLATMPGPTVRHLQPLHRCTQVVSARGIFVPKGTPKAIIARLNAESIKAVNDPATRERLRENALDPVGSSAEGLGRTTRDGHERMGN